MKICANSKHEHSDRTRVPSEEGPSADKDPVHIFGRGGRTAPMIAYSTSCISKRLKKPMFQLLHFFSFIKH
jgi:hypothetical protein